MERRWDFSQPGMLCKKRTSTILPGAVENGGERVVWVRLRDEESLLSSME